MALCEASSESYQKLLETEVISKYIIKTLKASDDDFLNVVASVVETQQKMIWLLHKQTVDLGETIESII